MRGDHEQIHLPLITPMPAPGKNMEKINLKAIFCTLSLHGFITLFSQEQARLFHVWISINIQMIEIQEKYSHKSFAC